MEKHPELFDQWWATFFKLELDKKGNSSPYMFHLIITGAELRYTNIIRYAEDSNLRFLVQPSELDKLLANIHSI
jgi:hypothetical protein